MAFVLVAPDMPSARTQQARPALTPQTATSQSGAKGFCCGGKEEKDALTWKLWTPYTLAY